MQRLSFIAALLMLGCASEGQEDVDDTSSTVLTEPDGDSDNDGYSNAEELEAGSDPDDASDVPYAGGWTKDASCNDDIQSTGNDVGQIAQDFMLQDQYGDTLRLHDFCDRVVLLEFAGFS